MTIARALEILEWRGGRRGAEDFLLRWTVHDTGLQGLLGVVDRGRSIVGRVVEEALQVGVAGGLNRALEELEDKKETKTRKGGGGM